MKNITIIKRSIFLLLLVLNGFFATSQLNLELPEKWNYGIEINNVLCGYTESLVETTTLDGREVISLKDLVFVKLSVLGGGVDMTVNNQYYIDPESMSPLSVEHVVKTSAEVYGYSSFEKDVAYFKSSREGEIKTIELGPDVIRENSITYPHIYEDFIKGDLEEKAYQVYDDMRGLLATKKYKRITEEKIELNEIEFPALILEEINEELGTVSKIWFDTRNSFPLKIEIANRNIYLANESVKKRITVVDMDNVLFAKVDQLIPDVPNISYMKVEASIESAGEWITKEDLNIPGQSFEGSVTNNLIEGIFEIRPIKYAGENAPSFPYEPLDESLRNYIEAENLIESDDPLLIEEAKLITETAKDSWEAAILLSKWVAENIKGAVPGGTSAINTYKTREGECGSHSRLLAAFCRAVGIPSRLSIGCMYSPYLGGSFGQHAWTEVYMGEAGWIPVDATAFEYDYIDAGHIRLGESSSFNPRSMKILEYKLKNSEVKKAKEMPDEYAGFVGKYLLKRNNGIFEIKYQDGGLGVLIPGQALMVLNEPDENGILYPKMTRQINFTFIRDPEGIVQEMKLQQVTQMQKTGELDQLPENVPADIKDYLGKYLLSIANATFQVSYGENGLSLYDPLANKHIAMKETDKAGFWIDEFDQNELEFNRDKEGNITGLVIHTNFFLEKQEE